jgi:dihydroflavonol-4-reductase
LKTLVTGATGLVGAELVRQLVERGGTVRILRRSNSDLSLLGHASAQVEHVIGDVSDAESLAPAMANIDRVYHVAAHVGFGGKREWPRLYRINVQGTANVVNAALAAGVKRLVHTSSMAAFGRPEQPTGIIDEAMEWQETSVNTPYAKSKYLAELEVHRAVAEGLDAVIVNPSLIFGAGKQGENTTRIVEQVRERKLPAIPTGGTNVVDAIDVADGHIRAMESGTTGERYFLGSENLFWRDIILMLANAFGVPPPRFTAPPPAALAIAALSETWGAVTRSRPLITLDTARAATRFYRYSHRKAVEELGCTFRPFEETAQRLATLMK